MQRTVFFKMEKREKRKYLYIAGLAVAICLIVQNFSLVITLLSLSFVALTPMLIGCIIAYIFNIIMNFFEKHYFPKSKSPKIIASRRPLCLILSFTIVIATITLVLKVVIPEFITAGKLFYDELPDLYERGKAFSTKKLKQYPRLQEQLNNIEIDRNEIVNKLTQSAFGLFGSVISFITSVTSALINTIIGVIFAIYLLLRKDKLANDIKRFQNAYLSEKTIRRMNRFFSTAHETFTNFFIGQFIEAIIIGTLTFIGSSILRLPYPAMTGTIIGVTALIPIFGALIGAALSAFIICTVSPTKALIFLVFLIILQQVDNNIFYPKVVGTSVGLPEIWVLAAITVGGSLFGIMGMLMGVPLVATFYKLAFYKLEKKETELAGVPNQLPEAPPDKPKVTKKHKK
ncbi:MAG: AI-2E family transporter [Ruminococcus flavefaciens]|nr:AI-2E family transporter [Ruminococcus flavefaciens]